MIGVEVVEADLDLGVYALAEKAEVHGPDTKESHGARLLLRVQDEANSVDSQALLDGIREFVAGGGDAEEFTVNDLLNDVRDEISEWADSCVQIYTYQCWQEFADLCLWDEDLSDWGDIAGDNLTRDVAMRAEYMVAERLLGILLAERAQALLEANPDPFDEDGDE